MSHYAVAVFSDDCDFDRLLAPYGVNNEDEMEFHPKEYSAITKDFERFHKQNPHYTLEMYIKTFRYVEHEGRWGSWYNDHGYWDYYTLDGKSYLFDFNKPPEEVGEYARKNDYDWYPDNTEDEDYASEFWDDYIGPNAKDEPPTIYSRAFYYERFKTKEQFVKEAGRTVPYAYITPDGVWHSPGRVLYFGMSDETATDWIKYIDEFDNYLASETNPYVSLVDCHA